MSKIVMPEAWNTPSQPVKTEAASKVDARVDMSAEVAGKGLCPVCQKEMEQGFADGMKVRFCREDLVTLPLSNEELADVDQEPEEDYSTWKDGNDTYGDAFN